MLLLWSIEESRLVSCYLGVVPIFHIFTKLSVWLCGNHRSDEGGKGEDDFSKVCMFSAVCEWRGHFWKNLVWLLWQSEIFLVHFWLREKEGWKKFVLRLFDNCIQPFSNQFVSISENSSSHICWSSLPHNSCDWQTLTTSFVRMWKPGTTPK